MQTFLKTVGSPKIHSCKTPTPRFDFEVKLSFWKIYLWQSVDIVAANKSLYGKHWVMYIEMFQNHITFIETNYIVIYIDIELLSSPNYT